MIDDAAFAALSHLLNQAEWARHRLAPFTGRHVRVSMPPWRFCFQVIEGGWVGVPADDSAADVRIGLPPEAPFLALQGSGAIMRRMRIEGDAQLGDTLRFVLNNLRWDYEEDLSRVVGDIAAHRLVGAISALATRLNAAHKEKGQPRLPFPFLLL